MLTREQNEQPMMRPAPSRPTVPSPPRSSSRELTILLCTSAVLTARLRLP